MNTPDIREAVDDPCLEQYQPDRNYGFDEDLIIDIPTDGDAPDFTDPQNRLKQQLHDRLQARRTGFSIWNTAADRFAAFEDVVEETQMTAWFDARRTDWVPTEDPNYDGPF